MIARKGDAVAPTLGALMSLSYRDHNENKKVYPTDMKNSKHEMPIHIVSMNKKCAQHIIQLLVKGSSFSECDFLFDFDLM